MPEPAAHRGLHPPPRRTLERASRQRVREQLRAKVRLVRLLHPQSHLHHRRRLVRDSDFIEMIVEKRVAFVQLDLGRGAYEPLE